MDVLRDAFDGFYDLLKPAVFRLTNKDAKKAHRLLVNSLKGLQLCGLSKLVLDNAANHIKGLCEISNAAGFVKNAEIDPRIMKLLGFDRVVVGTVTGDYSEGNLGQTIWRFPETNSLVNCEGVPSIGSGGVVEELYGYGEHGVPLTVSLMPTPGKNGKDALEDLKKIASDYGFVPYVDRLELSIACPNTYGSNGVIDTRKNNLGQLDEMVNVVRGEMNPAQDLYLKVSPDSSEADVDYIVGIGNRYGVKGYVTTNVTTNHNDRYISVSPGKGGASGDAVWDASIRTQKYFAERVGGNVELIGCGGIRSVERMHKRLAIGNCSEIQVFTPLIFEGTGLLRKLRDGGFGGDSGGRLRLSDNDLVMVG